LLIDVKRWLIVNNRKLEVIIAEINSIHVLIRMSRGFGGINATMNVRKIAEYSVVFLIEILINECSFESVRRCKSERSV
jgi:hypothetical protein